MSNSLPRFPRLQALGSVMVGCAGICLGAFGCADRPGASRPADAASDGPEDTPAEATFYDARDDGTFVMDLGMPGVGHWPAGPLPAPWRVSRIPPIPPPATDGGAGEPDGPAEDAAQNGNEAGGSDDAGGVEPDGAPDLAADVDVDRGPDLGPDLEPWLPLGARAEGDSFALTADGAGLPITGASDAFLFVHRPLVGDGAIVALARTARSCPGGRIDFGVMLRSSVAEDASYGMASVTGARGGATLMSRASSGWFSNVLRFEAAVALPVWLKVERHGARLRIGYSRDGQSWIEAERDLFDAPMTLEAGLVAASHAGATCSVLFERVALVSAAAQGP